MPSRCHPQAHCVQLRPSGVCLNTTTIHTDNFNVYFFCYPFTTILFSPKIMSYSPITHQPSKCSHMVQEKPMDDGSSCEGQCAHHSSCHRKRIRRVMMTTLMSLMTLMFFLCLSMGDFGSDMGLFKRQNTGTNNGQQGVFVRNKCA